MKKNLAGLGIEPQDYKMTYFETWCLSLQDHEISIDKWLIYQYINIGKSSTKPPKCPNLVLFFWINQLLLEYIYFIQTRLCFHSQANQQWQKPKGTRCRFLTWIIIYCQLKFGMKAHLRELYPIPGTH